MAKRVAAKDSTGNKRYLNKSIGSRVSEKTYNKLEKLASESSLSKSDVLKRLIDGAKLYHRITEEEKLFFRSVCGGMNNLNQLMRKINTYDKLLIGIERGDVDEVRNMFKEIDIVGLILRLKELAWKINVSEKRP